MQTELLIENLSRRVTPVTPLASPHTRLLRWLAAALPLLILLIDTMGTRADLPFKLHNIFFLTQTLLLILVVGASAHLAFLANVPGLTLSPLYRKVPLTALLLWTGLLGVKLFQALLRRGLFGFIPDAPGHCTEQICLLGLIPGVLLFLMLRKGKTLQKQESGVYLMLAAIGLGSLAAQFLCASSCPFHLLVWHLLPIWLFAYFGKTFAPKLL